MGKGQSVLVSVRPSPRSRLLSQPSRRPVILSNLLIITCPDPIPCISKARNCPRPCFLPACDKDAQPLGLAPQKRNGFTFIKQEGLFFWTHDRSCHPLPQALLPSLSPPLPIFLFLFRNLRGSEVPQPPRTEFPVLWLPGMMTAKFTKFSKLKIFILVTFSPVFF